MMILNSLIRHLNIPNVRGVSDSGEGLQIISYPAPRVVPVVEIADTLAILSAFVSTVTLTHSVPSSVFAHVMFNSFNFVVVKLIRLARCHTLRTAILAPPKNSIFQRTPHTLVLLTHPKFPTSLRQLALTLIRISVEKSVAHLPHTVTHIHEVSVEFDVAVDSKPQVCYGAVVHRPGNDSVAAGGRIGLEVIESDFEAL